jgi:hypothetical protein
MPLLQCARTILGRDLQSVAGLEEQFTSDLKVAFRSSFEAGEGGTRTHTHTHSK